MQIGGIDIDPTDRKTQLIAAVVLGGTVFVVIRSKHSTTPVTQPENATLQPPDGVSWSDVVSSAQDSGRLGFVGAYPQQTIITQAPTTTQPGPGGNPVPDGVRVATSTASCGLPGNKLASLDADGFLIITDKATGDILSKMSAGSVVCPSGRVLSAQPKPKQTLPPKGGIGVWNNPNPGANVAGFTSEIQPLVPSYAMVRPGDTLRSISARYGESWNMIPNLNNGLDRLTVGQRVRVK